MGEQIPVKGFKWDKMVFLTQDLREIVYTAPTNELAAFAWEKIPHP